MYSAAAMNQKLSTLAHARGGLLRRLDRRVPHEFLLHLQRSVPNPVAQNIPGNRAYSKRELI